MSSIRTSLSRPSAARSTATLPPYSVQYKVISKWEEFGSVGRGFLLDNVSCLVLLGAADDQIFRPVHEFSGKAVAAARQFGANVRALKFERIINYF